MKILTFIFLFSSIISFTQQSVYFCHPLFPYTTSELEDPGFVEDEQACFLFDDATNYDYPNGVNKDLKATIGHKIEPNFKMGSGNNNGRFTLEMFPEGVDVLLIEPNDINAVPKYEKLEFGIKIPKELKERIELFKADENDPNGINPFLSWEFQITATFEHELPIIPGFPGPQYYEKKVDAFYYEEFQRVIEPYTGGIPVNDEEYKTFGGYWDSIPNEYCFMLRFAPPAVGN